MPDVPERLEPIKMPPLARVLILQVLGSCDDALSSQEIRERIMELGFDLNMSTGYGHLGKLKEAGYVEVKECCLPEVGAGAATEKLSLTDDGKLVLDAIRQRLEMALHL